jgi:peptidoglycan/LPS O-acetylase OafA/YrhL
VRNKRLDVLRCIAVLLVLARHGRGRGLLFFVGWVGVDLFFVLSGFLISGLLFAEYKKRGSIDFKRFFVRRGFKIYPMFYLLILFTIAVQLVLHDLSPLRNYLDEIFYVQNYQPGIWTQTWSLAVEEHFYILLPLFLLVLIRFSRDRVNPFRAIPFAFLVVAAACLAFRIITMASVPVADLTWRISGQALTFTHERMDSLFFGVLLGYVYHFRPSYLRVLDSRPIAFLFALLAAALLFPCCIFSMTDGRFMLTIGLTLLYLGFGIVLMLTLQLQGIFRGILARVIAQIGNVFAFVGMYSYSIYIWHVAVSALVPGFIRRVSHYRIDLRSSDTFYVVVSIVFGILVSRLIEYPILRIRDRLFPAGPQPVGARQ